MTADVQLDPTPAPAPAPDPAPTPAPVADPTPAPTEQSWRERIAGGDEAILKMTGRYNSEHDFAKAYKELQTKVSSGEYKKAIPFPEGGTEEQVAAWRKENGIPLSPKEYDLSNMDGLTNSDDDKPYVDAFLEGVHAKNLSPEAARAAVGVYFEMQQKSMASAVEADRAWASEQEEVLRSKWGPEYLPNYNMAQNFAITRFGKETGEALMKAGADSIEAIAAIAREINPAATIVPNSSDPGKSIGDELAKLNGIIGTPEWYANPQYAQRYTQLIDAQNSFKR